MVRLLLIRHAETVWNASGRVQGQSDPPLSDRGRAQVEALRRRLGGVRLDRVVTSDLVRARETAAALGGEPTVTSELREVGVGSWEGLTREEMAAGWPEAWAAWQRSPSYDHVPGGESTAAFAARTRRALDLALAGAGDGATVAAVTHIGLIRVALSEVFGLPVEWQRWPWTVENTAITVLGLPALEGGWCPERVEVLAVNDAAHLDGVPD